MRPYLYQDHIQRDTMQWTHLDGTRADNIPRGSHPRGHLAPMRGERGGAPGTQANRSPPLPQHPRSPQQAHQQVRGVGGEGSRYNQEQLGQKSPPRRDPYQQQVSERGNIHPPPPMPGQGTHHPGGRSVPDQWKWALIQNISDDISQAGPHVKSEGSVIPMPSIEDSRPLDSNLICPMCNVQFRIGQIQRYRRHVDGCRGTRN